MIALVRVDNRLIHGQVVSTWIPHLKAGRVVVVDEEAATSPLMRAAMTMALPPSLEAVIERPSAVDWTRIAEGEIRTLLLVRDVSDLEAAVRAGLRSPTVNVGNVHFAEGRKPVSPSIFLSEEELAALERIAALGIAVEARAIPTDPGLGLPELRSRHREAR